MRFVFYFLFIISQSVSCQVTTTLPLETLSFETPNGAYLKDLDNKFPFWIDTWEGTVNNKKYTFTFVLFAQHMETYPSGNYIYRDWVVAKLKVTNTLNNNILYDESSFINFEDYKINGLYIDEDKFYFGLYDKEEYCYNNTRFIFKKDPNNPDQITYKNFIYGEYEYWDCPYTSQEEIPMFLPKVDLVLTRQ